MQNAWKFTAWKNAFENQGIEQIQKLIHLISREEQMVIFFLLLFLPSFKKKKKQ